VTAWETFYERIIVNFQNLTLYHHFQKNKEIEVSPPVFLNVAYFRGGYANRESGLTMHLLCHASFRH
jgi:hypothetical protein